MPAPRTGRDSKSECFISQKGGACERGSERNDPRRDFSLARSLSRSLARLMLHFAAGGAAAFAFAGVLSRAAAVAGFAAALAFAVVLAGTSVASDRLFRCLLVFVLSLGLARLLRGRCRWSGVRSPGRRHRRRFGGRGGGRRCA